jgi:hypothetical protein
MGALPRRGPHRHSLQRGRSAAPCAARLRSVRWLGPAGKDVHSADIVLPCTDGREIRLRRITEPTTEQESLLQQIGLRLPQRFELNRKCSVDFATA